MKKLQHSTLKKLGVSLLFALLLVCAVGIAANGWQEDPGAKEESKTPAEALSPLETDKEVTEPKSDPVPAEQHRNYLTNLPSPKPITSRDVAAFVMDPESPLYATSASPLTVELPIEDGKTRLLVYESNIPALGKIGALAESRAYFDTAASFFGGTVVSLGRDDMLSDYPSIGKAGSLNLSGTGLYFSEGVYYSFTSGNRVSDALSSASAEQTEIAGSSLPFLFSDGESRTAEGKIKAEKLIIPYGDCHTTSFYYSAQHKKYLLSYSGKEAFDLLTGKVPAFENVTVLFCDTILYSKSVGKELVPDLLSGGFGYALNGGKLTEIRWSVGEEGSLLFSTLDGERLTVPSGNHYIAYYPAVNSYDISFE